MARRLAIEWDDHEVRVMEAEASGGRLAAPRVSAISLAAHEGPTRVADVVAALRSGLGTDDRHAKDAVIVVSRDAMQVKQITLPAAPTEELPNMVRFQMVRELNSPLDGAALDFAVLPTSRAADQPLELFVAAVSAEAMREHQSVAEGLGLRSVAMPPRPVAVAELARAIAATGDRAPSAGTETQPTGEGVAASKREALLVIDFTTTAAEMTVLVDGQIVFARSHRWSEPVLEEGVPASVVARETLRTITAFQSHLPEYAVQRVVIFGEGQHHRPVATAISKQVGLNATIVDPLQALGISQPLGATPLTPAARGRFAALAGALLAQAQGSKYRLDFLNPKQPPVRRSRKKLYTTAAAAAAVLIVGGSYGLVRAKMARQDRLADALTKHIAQLDEQLQLADPIIKSAETLQAWQEGEVIWLDELHNFAELFPENTDACLDQLSLSIDTQAKTKQGKLSFSAYAKDQATVTALQTRLRQRRDHYRVQPKINQPSSQNAAYTRKFGSDVTLVNVPSAMPADAEANGAAEVAEAKDKAPAESPTPATDGSEPQS